MDLSSIVRYAQGSAYGLLVAFIAVAIWAFYTGKVHSDREFSKLQERCDQLEKALAAERQRSDEAVRAGTVTNQLIGALRDVVTERQSGKPEPGLTAEDVGL